MDPGPNERRRQPRRSISTTGSNPVVATMGIVPRAALVCDLSPEGIGLVTTDPPPVGSIVPVWLAIPPGNPSTLLLGRVIYVRATSPDLHRVGLSWLDDSGQTTLVELLARLSVDPDPGPHQPTPSK